MNFLSYFSVVSYGRFLFALYLFLCVFPTVSNANKCAVFDAFKVLPENVTSFVGGAFALHATDCNELLWDSVQEIVALQWVLSHWNAAQKVATSQIGLYVGDSCSRPKEAVLQSLRYLDFVDFYEPKECAKKEKNGSLIGILSPKDRASAVALSGILQSTTNIMVGAYTTASAEALIQHTNGRILVTVPLIEDYIASFSALMTAMESDLLIVVTCEEKSSYLDLVLKYLKDQQLHVSEVISLQHNMLVDVLSGTDSHILLYLPCENSVEEFQTTELNRGPKLVVTIGIHDSDVHFPYRITGSQEIIIRQIRTDLPRFKPYMLDLLLKNYQTYALFLNSIQKLMNCSFASKTCPTVDMQSLSGVYQQTRYVDAVVRVAYSFAVAARFVDADPRLKELCNSVSRECLDGIFMQLTSMRFVHEKRGPLELANEELGFFPKSSSVVQSIGLRLEAVMGGSEEIFMYIIAREPKLISKGLPVELRPIRSICQPYHSFCGNCERSVLVDHNRVFLNRQQVSNFYVAGLFDLHSENCEEVNQNAIISALAFTHTMNTMVERYPNLSLRPMKDYSAIVVDSCSETFRSRRFTVESETQCMKLPLNEYNVSIPAGTVLGYVSSLSTEERQTEHIALLRGMRIPAISMNSNFVSNQRKGVLGLQAKSSQIAQAVAEFLLSMRWDYISVIVSADDLRSRATFDEFASMSSEYDLCIGSVLFYSPQNRTRLNGLQTTNVTVFFTTPEHAAEYVNTRLRFDYESNGHVNVMVGEAQDFYLFDLNNMFQHAGTVAIKMKDVLPYNFKQFLSNVTPLTLPEPWFWEFVERRWRCALSLQNRARYEGRMCTGDELLNIIELGRMTEIGYLIRGFERMLIGLDAAFRKACGSDTRDFCSEFLENGRKLLRDELDAERFKVEFEVDEFLPLDHHGNLGYRKIGNYTVEGKYNEIDEYRHYVGGNLKSDFQLTSNCVAPLCVCNKQLVRSGNKRSSSSNSKLLRGQQGGIRWFYAPTSMLLKLEETMLNYVLLGSTATVISVAVITLLLIIYKVYTRVIKGNQSLGILSLIGIIALNLTACLHILDGAEEITNLRLLLSDMGHCTCFGVIFIKAIRLRNAEDLCSERKTSNIGYFNYVLLMFFVLAVQIAIHLHQIDTVALQEVYAQAYIAILLLFALWINVKNREIRRNYKESKWLFIANLMALALYASWAVIRSLVDHSSIRYVDIVELNLMGLLLLTFLFGPKIYILLLYEPFVVERCTTPMKQQINEDDLFGCHSPDISTHTNASRKGSLSAHRSGSTVTADEFPVLKTVLRKRDQHAPIDKHLRASHLSDRHSSSSNCS